MKTNQINKSTSSLRALVCDERGMSTVEYVILLAVIVMGAVSLWSSIGGNIIASLQGSDAEISEIPKNAEEAQNQ